MEALNSVSKLCHCKGWTLLFAVFWPTLIIIIYYGQQSTINTHHTITWREPEDGKYLISMPSCKIWNMDPFDPALTKFYRPRSSFKKCNTIPLKTTNTILEYDKTYRNYEKVNCCYRTIERIHEDTKNYSKSADLRIKISTDCVPVPKEGLQLQPAAQFIKMECTGGSRQVNDYLASVFPPQNFTSGTREKTKYWQSGKEKRKPEYSPRSRPPNVLLLGIDSVSRLHSLRSLPETRKFVEQNDFIEMKGFTKIGENTFPNLMASLGGMEYLKWPCYNSSIKMDDCPLIWKNFSANQYVTAKYEDDAYIANFNFEKVGFVQQPFDYYFRPIAIAYNKQAWPCVGGATRTINMIKNIKEFLKAVEGVPYFLLAWFTTVAHESLNELKPYDRQFKNLISEVLNGPDAGNTIIFFISDHGLTHGHFRESFLGYYEESLPFFYVRLPPSLKELNPTWYQNLFSNSRRLTSPLDMHATLEDILSLSTSTILNFTHGNGIQNYARKAYSFFEETPLNRSCSSSAIPEEYCRCGVTPKVAKQGETSVKFQTLLISKINEILKEQIKSGLCVARSFRSFFYVRELTDGESWNNKGKLERYKDYLVGLAANPRNSRFEAIVRALSDGTMSIVGEIRLISSYAKQSDCVHDVNLKHFCICSDWHKKQLEKEAAKKAKAAVQKKGKRIG